MEEETLAQLWEIAQQMAGEDATLKESASWTYCNCCDADRGGWGYDFQHASDCIVLKARALIKEQNPRSIEQERSIDMGGKPSKGTPADKRLKENKPKIGTPPALPTPPSPQKKPMKGK